MKKSVSKTAKKNFGYKYRERDWLLHLLFWDNSVEYAGDPRRQPADKSLDLDPHPLEVRTVLFIGSIYSSGSNNKSILFICTFS